MQENLKIEVNKSDWKWAAVIGFGFFLILFIGSLFDHKYSIPMRYVSFGMLILIEFMALYSLQVGKLEIELTENEFIFKSPLKKRVIPYNRIKDVKLKKRNTVVDAIFKIEVENGIDFKFDRYNVSDKDINRLISELNKYCSFK